MTRHATSGSDDEDDDDEELDEGISMQSVVIVDPNDEMDDNVN